MSLDDPPAFRSVNASLEHPDLAHELRAAVEGTTLSTQADTPSLLALLTKLTDGSCAAKLGQVKADDACASCRRTSVDCRAAVVVTDTGITVVSDCIQCIATSQPCDLRLMDVPAQPSSSTEVVLGTPRITPDRDTTTLEDDDADMSECAGSVTSETPRTVTIKIETVSTPQDKHTGSEEASPNIKSPIVKSPSNESLSNYNTPADTTTVTCRPLSPVRNTPAALTTVAAGAAAVDTGAAGAGTEAHQVRASLITSWRFNVAFYGRMAVRYHDKEWAKRAEAWHWDFVVPATKGKEVGRAAREKRKRTRKLVGLKWRGLKQGGCM